MKKVRVKVLRGDKQQVKRDLVLKKGRLYILKDKKLRVEIIWLYYDILATRYKERWKMIELVTRHYWWLGMTKNVRKYIDRYDMYQRIRNQIEVPAGKLMINKVLKRP